VRGCTEQKKSSEALGRINKYSMRDAESVTLTERDIEAKGMTFHRPPPIM
jgi:hypothetical protein